MVSPPHEEIEISMGLFEGHSEKGVRNRLQFRVPLMSDNQGNLFAMLNQSTRKMPTATILMQLVLSLH